MNCTTAKEKFHDHADGELAPEEARRLEAHLADCTFCHREMAALRDLLAQAKKLPREIAPTHNLWRKIEARCIPPVEQSSPSAHRRWWPYLGLAAAAAVVLGLTWRPGFRPSPTPGSWAIAAVAGTPQVDRKDFQGAARLGVGQWLETDRASSAKIDVGSIGQVNVEPNSRVRLVGVSPTDHRVELARGTLRALIWAPPRLFFVNTPSATAIDLGCAYTLSVDDDGAGLLHVTSGYVALEHDGRESIIPAGFKCATRQRFGPGTPFALDASAELRMALERFDFEAGGPVALGDVLKSARSDDAITLWHLLGRVDSAHRGDVFDALGKFHVVPAGVTRAGIVAGDTVMRNAWARELGFGRFVTR